MSDRRDLALMLGTLVFLAGAAPTAAAVFPMEEGEVVASCFADPDGANPQQYVVGIMDVRDPGCDPTAVKGENWMPPAYHNEMPNPTGDPADEWTRDNLGHVFGLALDAASPPNIYVTSTSSYIRQAAEYATGRVFRLDGVDGSISVLADLPNQIFDTDLRPGLGNVAYDADHDQLFVTNMEDGKIYRISLAGAVLETFDPFQPDDGAPGFPPLGERLWGIGVDDCRVYFSVWAEDCGRPDSDAANTVWSVGLDAATGAFAPSDLTLEITLPHLPSLGRPAASNPVADIELSDEGRMLLGERTMIGDFRTNAHASRMLEYVGGHGNWTLGANEFRIGIDGIAFSCGEGDGTNAAGGVDYECLGPTTCEGHNKIWASGDALKVAPDSAVYGIQGTPRSGGGPEDSYLVDLDGDLMSDAKTLLGDVDVYRTCRSPRRCVATISEEIACTGCVACNDPGLCSASIACDPGVAVCASGEGFQPVSCDPAGPYLVGTTLVQASCGGEQAGCEVSVQDCEPPTCLAPDPLEIECSGPCGSPASDPEIQAWLSDAAGDDNCGVDALLATSLDRYPSGCGPGLASEVVFRVTDTSGRVATCSSTVSVIDTTPPELAVPPAQSAECAAPGGLPLGHPLVQDWLDAAAAQDLCGGAVLDHDAPGLFPAGCSPGTVTEVLFSAADGCGNAVQEPSTLTVVDSTPPELTLPPPLVLECDQAGGVPAGDPRIELWLSRAEASDVCGTATLTHDAPAFFPAGCLPGTVTSVTFTATDECGNSVEGSSTVTVVDSTPPELAVPPPLVLECDGAGGIPADDPRIALWLGAARASDGCGPADVGHDAPARFPAGCIPGAETEVTFTATDGCGQSTSATSSVTVVDSTPPAVEPCGLDAVCLWPPDHGYVCFEDASSLARVDDACSDDVEILAVDCVSSQCDDAPCPQHPGENGDGATTDDCFWDPATDRLCARAERAGTEEEGRFYTVTFTVADECGQMAEAEVFTITVPHDQDPHAGCLSAAPAAPRRSRPVP